MSDTPRYVFVLNGEEHEDANGLQEPMRGIATSLLAMLPYDDHDEIIISAELRRPRPTVTLGDIAVALRKLRDEGGVTRESIEYVIEKVFYE